MYRKIYVGIGNTLRTDDGAGPLVVQRLESELGQRGDLCFVVAHQLLPEFAVELASARRVVFIDAACDTPAGALRCRRVVPAHVQSLGHRVTPEALLAWTQAAFGRCPRAVAYTIGAESLEFGERLRPCVELAVDRLTSKLGHPRRTAVGHVCQT